VRRPSLADVSLGRVLPGVRGGTAAVLALDADSQVPCHLITDL
jgi:hypothetical protein